MKIWTFQNSGEAYDTIQCDDEINKGDIVLIPSEKIVGIADACPIAITSENGEFHQAIEGELAGYLLEKEIDHHLSEAITMAAQFGFDLLPELAEQTDEAA